ncbi:unnamed protein product [Blepharisma stoltei]|uniref:Uncharacterized protein n=1 Tax=Blepharisma stoltei TaxID=1481888 RepID=A0AAU9K0L4_9CILI|nr:unnamed protein product [Blepharisma stoltei]
MLTNGTGILLIGESSYKSSTNGVLAIVEKGKEMADSYEKYLSVSISEMIGFLSNNSSSIDSLVWLLKQCPKNYCSNEFSLINIQQRQRMLVGSIKNQHLTLSSALIFPGNSTNIPVSHPIREW